MISGWYNITWTCFCNVLRRCEVLARDADAELAKSNDKINASFADFQEHSDKGGDIVGQECWQVTGRI